MEITASRLTILFEDPFWIGLYERESDGQYEVCKITFGAEPRDGEVYAFLLKNWHRLRFSPSVKSDGFDREERNPKRMQREISRQLAQTGVGTKAQQALALQREQGKIERKARTRAQREAEQTRRFELRQEKHREKHRGH